MIGRLMKDSVTKATFKKNETRSGVRNRSLGNSVIGGFLVIWALVQIFPLYWLFTFSLKDNREIFGHNIIGLPQNWIWENYTAVMTRGRVGLYFLNSVFVTGATIIITSIFALMATYALTRMVFKGRKALNNIFMLGLTVPVHAAILPIFIILRDLKMTDSYQSLIIPYSAFALAMAILIGTSFIEGIPVELEEAAFIDGCSIYGIFARIILPLMRPALAAIAIFTYLQAWNELMFAIIFISKSQYRTLSVGIQNLSGSYTTNWGPIGAALVIATLPTLVIYFLMGRKIQECLVIGSVKG